MNLQMRFAPTVEARLAGAVMRVLRHFATKYGRENVMAHVDHKDFTDAFLEDMKPSIRRELLLVRLEALQIQPGERESEKRKTLRELAEIDHPQDAT